MTPSARIQAAIEILAEVEVGGGPADRTITQYLRSRRYIGGGDRRAIGERVYGVMRRRGSLAWRLAQGGAAPGPRALVAAALMDEMGGAEAVAALFDGSRYGPAPLTDAECAQLAALPVGGPEMPAWARLEYPEWLDPAIRARFGEDFETEMAALARPAALDLRVNALKADRAGVRAALAADGHAAEPTPFSPWGLRFEGRPPLASHRAYRDGLVEVQDEGAQLVALLTEAEPGMTVIDYCAGAGGKTLALAAAMADRGRLVACDSDGGRLKRMTPRVARAGASIVDCRVVEPGDPPDDLAGIADRVLLDMPCSGTGTWRRNPDARWRLTPERLAEHAAGQAQILDAAAPLVRPGGRLVYATCSFLVDENEAVVDAFLARSPGWDPLPLAPIWARTVGGDCPAEGTRLRLTPRRHGTDAFFLTVLERPRP